MIPLRAEPDLSDWTMACLGHRFADPKLCVTALTHRSAAGAHNERLEFLGDSVLNCAVAHLLYEADSAADEGTLSRRRATLVSGESLAQVAAGIGLGDHLRLGSGEVKSGGYRRASILADALEALIGAVFLDAGFNAACAVIERLLGARLADLAPVGALKDAKTRLQEALQGRALALPVYTLTGVSGEAHEQTFAVTCECAAFSLVASGEGASRRRAEQAAAERLLEQLPAGLLRKT